MTPPPGDAPLVLPAWAQVTPPRLAHIGRVVALIEQWADAMDLEAVETSAWRDAARWHDALRDAPEPELRALTGDTTSPVGLLHGPAAAARLVGDGERRVDVLDAIRYHTTGSVQWSRTGRALYMADFLEPGRRFLQRERVALAGRVPTTFDAVFSEVVELRVGRARREGRPVAARSLELLETVRAGHPEP